MRARLLVLALAVVTGCSDDPSAEIIVPLPDTTVVASVELRIHGHRLTGTTETKIYLDLEPYSDLLSNSLPSECGDCEFVVAFAGASISNGEHAVAVFFYEGETELASDTINLVFAR